MRFKDASCSLVIIRAQRSHVRIMRGRRLQEGGEAIDCLPRAEATWRGSSPTRGLLHHLLVYQSSSVPARVALLQHLGATILFSYPFLIEVWRTGRFKACA